MSEKRTRSKKEPNKTTEASKSSIVSDKNVFFIRKNILELGQNIEIEKLRHPGSEKPAYFIISKAINSIYEILQFKQPHRSWLIDENVSSNGKFSITSPIDPVFFALYYIRKNCSEQVIPLDQIKDNEYPKTIQLIEDYFTDEMLLTIADRKGPSDCRAFKFNKEKAIACLAVKTKRLVKLLKLKNIHVGDSAVSANFVKADKQEEANEGEYLQYAIGIIGNYLTMELHKELLDYFNIKEDPVTVKRKSLKSVKEPIAKKVKVEKNTSIVMEMPKEKKISAKEMALKKAASGSKTISSFFKK